MSEKFLPVPSGKARIIVRVLGDRVLLDMLVDDGSVNVINLPGGYDLKLESVEEMPAEWTEQ